MKECFCEEEAQDSSEYIKPLKKENYSVFQCLCLQLLLKMQRVLNELKSVTNWKILFQEYASLNHLSQLQIQKLSQQNLHNLDKHLKKIVQKQHNKIKTSWVSTQYQILKLFANAISAFQCKLIEEFVIDKLSKDQDDWLKLQQIFYYKEPQTIKYELIRIVMDKKQHRRRWSVAQQNFLITIVKKSTKKNKWNQVARQLFIISNGEFYRQGKHCRERWLNHLHPSIQNQQWTDQQDIQLLKLILKKGKKWAKIAKKFSMKRSQCMVKKRFFQLIDKNQSLFISNQMFKHLVKKAIQDKLKTISSSIQADVVKQSFMKKQQNEEITRKISGLTEQFEPRQKQNILKDHPKCYFNVPVQENYIIKSEVDLPVLQQNDFNVAPIQLTKIQADQFSGFNTQNMHIKSQLTKNRFIEPIHCEYGFPWDQRHQIIESQGFKPIQSFNPYQNFSYFQNNLGIGNYYYPYGPIFNNMPYMEANPPFLKRRPF